MCVSTNHIRSTRNRPLSPAWIPCVHVGWPCGLPTQTLTIKWIVFRASHAMSMKFTLSRNRILPIVRLPPSAGMAARLLSGTRIPREAMSRITTSCAATTRIAPPEYLWFGISPRFQQPRWSKCSGRARHSRQRSLEKCRRCLRLSPRPRRQWDTERGSRDQLPACGPPRARRTKTISRQSGKFDASAEPPSSGRGNDHIQRWKVGVPTCADAPGDQLPWS